MKNKKLVLIFACSLLIIGTTLTLRSPAQRQSADEEVKRLDYLARSVLKLDLGKVTDSGGSRNMVGLRSDRMVFSHRLDSRTYFVQDNRYGLYKEAGVFQSSDAELLDRSREILQHLGIPAEEIAKAVVLKENYQTGQVDPKTKKVSPGKVQEGRRMANLSRQVEGVPIFSSRALIGLTREKGIGLMELHWPVIPKETVREAQNLEAVIKRGWQPPTQKGGRVESVEAGIIHSPAVGFVLDIYPAIRIIYAPEDRRVGKKAVYYLDANGKSVPVPRQFEKIDLPSYKNRTRKTNTSEGR